MPRLCEIVCRAVGIRQRMDRSAAFFGGDSGAHAFVVDCDRESSTKRGGRSCGRKRIELQLLSTFGKHRHTEHAPPCRDHEVHHLWRALFCCANEIAFVFAIFVIQHNDDFAGCQCLYSRVYL